MAKVNISEEMSGWGIVQAHLPFLGREAEGALMDDATTDNTADRTDVTAADDHDGADDGLAGAGTGVGAGVRTGAGEDHYRQNGQHLEKFLHWKLPHYIHNFACNAGGHKFRV